jgi:Tfp pilus assembly protein PilE
MHYLLKIKAMSLIEIIVTITMVFILSTVSIYSYQEYKVKANINSALVTIEQNKLAISSYYAQNKMCPCDNFINQTLNNSQCSADSAIPCVATISNVGCNLNMLNGNSEIIMYFAAKISTLGDFQYFCVPSNTKPIAKKYLSLSCNGIPAASNNYVEPDKNPSCNTTL